MPKGSVRIGPSPKCEITGIANIVGDDHGKEAASAPGVIDACASLHLNTAIGEDLFHKLGAVPVAPLVRMTEHFILSGNVLETLTVALE